MHARLCALMCGYRCVVRCCSHAEVVIGYASGPGQQAYEPDRPAAGTNSYYTAALLRRFRMHGATEDIREVLGYVRKDVFNATRERQRPWVEECLLLDVRLFQVRSACRVLHTSSVASPCALIVAVLQQCAVKQRPKRQRRSCLPVLLLV